MLRVDSSFAKWCLYTFYILESHTYSKACDSSNTPLAFVGNVSWYSPDEQFHRDMRMENASGHNDGFSSSHLFNLSISRKGNTGATVKPQSSQTDACRQADLKKSLMHKRGQHIPYPWQRSGESSWKQKIWVTHTKHKNQKKPSSKFFFLARVTWGGGLSSWLTGHQFWSVTLNMWYKLLIKMVMIRAPLLLTLAGANPKSAAEQQPSGQAWRDFL